MTHDHGSSSTSFLRLSSNPSQRRWRDLVLKAVLFVFFLVFLSIHFADPIRLVTADLGRHLKNGELILAGESRVFTSNFYSYTYPEYPFVNHHWATGILFYWIYQMGGFTGLSFFYIGVLLCGFCVYFLLAYRFAGFSYALFFSVLAMPLFTDRLEIRPEGITTLLTGLFLYLLFMHRAGRVSFRTLAVSLAVLQVIWVNTHILFFIGGFLVVAFLLDAWLADDRERMRRMLIVVGITAVVSFINPAGIKGALVPLTIFKEYGYRLAENQTVFFMQKRFGQDPKYLYFECLSLLAVAGLGAYLLNRRWRRCLAEILVLLFFLALGLKTVRSMAGFAFVCVPLLSLFTAASLERFGAGVKDGVGRVLVISAAGLIAIGVCVPKSLFSPVGHLRNAVELSGGAAEDENFGYLLTHPQVITGLVPGINGAADFVIRNDIKGPIFNNYDIGGYLIFHLYPRLKVFVDNRPEVYSVSFFKNDYIPMQENDEVWRRMDRQYGFNMIFFYRHDLTPWGQNFLVNRIQDPEWAPVYVDLFCIIFLKRNEQNRTLIAAFEIPRDRFAVTR